MRPAVALLRHEGPFEARREAGAASATLARGLHLVDDGVAALVENGLGVVPAAALARTGKPSLADKNRPAAIARPETPDDLKLISGVGPKIEGILHELGIFTFAQVASWKKAEREWVDSYLNFKGRIERDDWVKQAKALAKGGEAEYIRVFGKKPR
jgi:NADH-quinone oxidoreductase subunit E